MSTKGNDASKAGSSIPRIWETLSKYYFLLHNDIFSKGEGKTVVGARNSLLTLANVYRVSLTLTEVVLGIVGRVTNEVCVFLHLMFLLPEIINSKKKKKSSKDYCKEGRTSHHALQIYIKESNQV